MPKNTFYNLSDEKKQRIFAAAVQEFSVRRFSDASVNQIVKNAKIPWGSFYQYFNDKEDLYCYMYQEILKEKREILRSKVTLTPDMDVFDICMETTKATFEWAKDKPEYNQIGILMDLENSEFITRLRTDSSKNLRTIIERDKARGIIRPDVDSDLVMDIIYALLVKEYYWSGSNEELFFKKFGDTIEILKRGILVPKNE